MAAHNFGSWMANSAMPRSVQETTKRQQQELVQEPTETQQQDILKQVRNIVMQKDEKNAPKDVKAELQKAFPNKTNLLLIVRPAPFANAEKSAGIMMTSRAPLTVDALCYVVSEMDEKGVQTIKAKAKATNQVYAWRNYLHAVQALPDIEGSVPGVHGFVHVRMHYNQIETVKPTDLVLVMYIQA